MRAEAGALSLRMVASIDEIPAALWDGCAGSDNPSVSHAFLAALEHSGSVGPEAGWLPRHLVAEAANGTVVAVVPLYAKGHSYGEYVFDHAWASAYERAGGRYYPKFQVAVPFTPVPGPRLLIGPEGDAATAPALAQGLIELTRRVGLSSLHVTFARDLDCVDLEAAGFALRLGYQFHWTNRGYGSFEDFLADLASRKRKAVKKERRDAASHGLEIRALTGSEIEERHWQAFHRLYLSTSDRKWGNPYLTLDFFLEIGRVMAEKLLLVVAEKDGRMVAGALNLIGSDTLYGRNWGAAAEYPFLHFEVCYYQALDFAIARGLARVEAGAQGEHKLQRGYLPSATHSAHWIADPGFRAAVVDFLARERASVTAEMAMLMAHSPFRQDGDTA